MKKLDGTDYEPTDEDFIAWQNAYPNVDVFAEYAAAESWIDANPKRRKKNCKAFVNNWLNRASKQEKGVSPFAEKAQEQGGKLTPKQMTALDHATHDFMNYEPFRQRCLAQYGQYVTHDGVRVTA